MNIKTVLIVHGEPNSTFSEILFKYFESIYFMKNKMRIILIGSKNLIEKQMQILNFDINLNEINTLKDSKKNCVNILNVDYKFKNAFKKISKSSNNYIENCFKIAIDLVKKNKSAVLINGPISKKHFLQKKFPGITEYISNKTNTKDPVMLIYNKKLSVSPLTTHIPIKNVSRFIKKNKIINNVIKIDKFYKKILRKVPNIAILGLNPHCESIENISEEKKAILPAINHLYKRKIRVFGPFPADTFFLKKNINKFDVVVGMYHDQVLTPAKTLFEFNAINITLGLPFLKITPDHGPNYSMIGENKSNPSSIFYALNFINDI